MDNIPNITNNVDLIVSEACYGGYILDKTIDDFHGAEIDLNWQPGIGVASTCIAYGSVYTPLIGADLFSFIMWKYTKDGYPFGEAFMKAKIGLVNVMTERQGYLDGEDQKTLLSFVLYGDPLGCLEETIYPEKSLPRDGHLMEIKTVSDQDGSLAKAPRISKDTAASLNTLLSSYMPGLDNASMKVREHQIRVKKVIHTSGGEKICATGSQWIHTQDAGHLQPENKSRA